VGRIFILPDRIADDTSITAFILWFGVEDLIVYLTGHISKLDDTYSPGEGLLVSLETSICSQPHSSLAEIPWDTRQFEAHEFQQELSLQGITARLMAKWHIKFAKQ
jgi:hypothetical protein